MRVLCPEATATCPNIHTHPAVKKGNTGARPAYNHNMHNEHRKASEMGRNLQNDSLADVATGVAQIQYM